MKIVVVSGGLSPERDVSLSSGSMIANALINAGHSVALIDIYFGIPGDVEITSLFTTVPSYHYSIPEQAPDLEAVKASRLAASPLSGNSLIGPRVLDVCRAADITYIALHGAMGENGQLQATLDTFGIRYTGSGYDGSLLAMNKDLSKQLLHYHGIHTADWRTYHTGEMSIENIITDAENAIGFPCVVKPCSCGSSIGVSIVENACALRKALLEAQTYENSFLIEKKIVGREFSIGVLGDQALPPIEIIPLQGFYDYKNKYQGGCTKEICPADITEEEDQLLRKTALEAHRVLRLRGYSRTDIILTADGLAYCLEVNTLPGMTPNSLLPQEAAAVGISYQQLCCTIAETALH